MSNSTGWGSFGPGYNSVRTPPNWLLSSIPHPFSSNKVARGLQVEGNMASVRRDEQVDIRLAALFAQFSAPSGGCVGVRESIALSACVQRYWRQVN